MATNRNGLRVSGQVSDSDDSQRNVATLNDLVHWQNQLRASIINSISEQDLQEITRAQVEKAKAGDERALKVVLDMIGAKNPVTINQTLIVDPEAAARFTRTAKLKSSGS